MAKRAAKTSAAKSRATKADRKSASAKSAAPAKNNKTAKSAAANGALKETATVIKLGPVMDLLAATDLKDDILEVLGVANGMGIDAAEVETLTTPCVQVLVAAGHAMAKRGEEFSIDNPTPAVRAAFEDLGLSPDFGRWSDTK